MKNIPHVDLEAELDRITTELELRLRSTIANAGYKLHACFPLPSPRAIEAMRIGDIAIPPADAAMILDLLETLGRVHTR